MKRIDNQNLFEFTGLKPENYTEQSLALLDEITNNKCADVMVHEVTDSLVIIAKTERIKFQRNSSAIPLEIDDRKRLKPGSRLIVNSEPFFVVKV